MEFIGEFNIMDAFIDTLEPVMLAYQDILSAAKLLGDVERSLLIDELSLTLPQEPTSELSPAWKEELQRRAKLMDEGKMKFYTWDEVSEQLDREDDQDA